MIDGRDVRHDRQREDRETADRAARKHVEQAEHAGLGLLAGFSEEGAALGIEMNALLGPFEQSNAQLLLELHDLTAERRLRDVQQFGRTTDIAGFGDSDEVAELAQVEHFYPKVFVLVGLNFSLISLGQSDQSKAILGHPNQRRPISSSLPFSPATPQSSATPTLHRFCPARPNSGARSTPRARCARSGTAATFPAAA